MPAPPRPPARHRPSSSASEGRAVAPPPAHPRPKQDPRAPEYRRALIMACADAMDQMQAELDGTASEPADEQAGPSIELRCQNCGKPYRTLLARAGQSRFCGTNCRTAGKRARDRAKAAVT